VKGQTIRTWEGNKERRERRKQAERNRKRKRENVREELNGLIDLKLFFSSHGTHTLGKARN